MTVKRRELKNKPNHGDRFEKVLVFHNVEENSVVVIYGIQAKNGLLWGHRQGYGDTEITFGNMFEISIDDFWKLVSFEPIIEIDVFELPGFKAAYASQN